MAGRGAVTEELAGGTASTTFGPRGASEAAAARLVRAAQELAAARDLPAITLAARRAARDLSGADGVTFVLREGEFVRYADEEAIAPLWKGRRFPARACISGWAMDRGCAVIIEDVREDPRVPQDAYRPTFVRSLAMVPVRPEAPVAALGAYWARRHRATAREIELLEALAGLTAVALTALGLEDERRRAVGARDAFLRSAAHQLRTPLTPLLLNIGRALKALETGDPATAHAALARAREQVLRTSALLDDLLDGGRTLLDGSRHGPPAAEEAPAAIGPGAAPARR